MTSQFDESKINRRKSGPGGGRFDTKHLDEQPLGAGGVDLVGSADADPPGDNSDWHLYTSAPQCGATHRLGDDAHMWGEERNWCPGNPLDASGLPTDPDDAWSGSGWGSHRPTAQVGDVASVQPGDVIAEHSHQFGARNLIRVARVDTKRGIFHGHFADPTDPSKLRDPDDREIAVWDFALQPDRSASYYSTGTRVEASLTSRVPHRVPRGTDGAAMVRAVAGTEGFCEAPKAATTAITDAQAAGFDVTISHGPERLEVYISKDAGTPQEKSMQMAWAKTVVYDQPASAGQLGFRTSMHGSKETVRFDYAEGRGIDSTGRLGYVAPKSLRQARLMVGIETK